MNSTVGFDTENVHGLCVSNGKQDTRISPFSTDAAGGGRCSYLELLRSDHSLCDDFLCVLVQDTLLLLDPLVHQRLSEHRLVHLVVAVASVAHLACGRES